MLISMCAALSTKSSPPTNIEQVNIRRNFNQDFVDCWLISSLLMLGAFFIVCNQLVLPG